MKLRYTTLFVCIVLCVGCHAKLKKFARSADTVELEVAMPGGAQVDLAEGSGGGSIAEQVTDAVVSTVASVESGKIEERVRNALAPDIVRDMVFDGSVRTLGNGPPFGTQGDGIDGKVSIAVLGYGIVQRGGGPAFFVDLKMYIYKNNGKRVYRKARSCEDHEFHTVDTIGNVAGTAATIAYLNKMSDDQIREKLKSLVDQCTQQIVIRMREHAS